MIHYGILSTAQVVPRFVRGIQESAEGVATAIASRELAKAEGMARELGIPKAYGSYEELCSDDEIDIVYIATYNKGHYEAAELALEHGKHVLLEKPFTLKLMETRVLFNMAEANDLFLMEAQKAVFLPVTKKIKQLLDDKKIGTIRWVQSVTSYPNIDHIKWFRSLAAGGGILRGAGTYPLEYISYLLGEPITDYSGIASFGGEVDSQCSLALRLGKETVANLFMTVDLTLPNLLTIYGEEGRIEVPDFWKTKEAMVYYKDGRVEKIEGDFSSEFVFEIDHVNQLLAEGKHRSPVMTEELTETTVGLIDYLYQQWLEEE